MTKNQPIPWLRIGAESVAIVGSILLAFAIDAWYAGRLEQQIAADYEQRIAAELRNLLDDLDRQTRTADRAFEYALVAESFFEGTQEEVDKDRLIVALYNMGRDYANRFDTSIYQELVSSGRLGLISDSEKRAAIQYVYELIPRYEENRYPFINEYTLRVRGLIPERLVRRIREVDGCTNMAGIEWDCTSVDFDDASADAILSRLATEEAYMAFRARMQGLGAIQRTTSFIKGEVEEALAFLD